MKPTAIVDPHPRTLGLLFNKEELKRLKSLATLTVWEGSRMPPDLVEKHLPGASQRAPHRMLLPSTDRRGRSG